MCDALNQAIIPRKQRKEDDTNMPELPTLNVQDLDSMGLNQNQNNSNSVMEQKQPDLPPNFQLVPFDDGDDETDQFLLDYIAKNPENDQQMIPQKQHNITTTTNMNTMSTSMPIIPKMYFPNSNVTINYNFAK